MRVIAGTLGGRLFDAPTGNTTHPTSDRIKGALFNTLGDIAGYAVLDAYAGSGALGFEAISRGAQSVIAIEKDRKSFATLSNNILKLGLSKQVKAVRANVVSWSENNNTKLFDLIICDPPFDDLREDAIEQLTIHLKPKGLMVLSKAGRQPALTVNGVVVVDVRSYGTAELVYYRSESV